MTEPVKVRLVTREGELASEVEIPPFKVPPEIIIWGSRAFVWRGANTWREAMAYYVPPPVKIFNPITKRDA